MTSFQKNGFLNVVHVALSYMLLPKNTWKETSGSILTPKNALVDGNE